MPNTKRGFGSAGLIIVILIIITGGAYLWSQKKVEVPAPIDVSSETPMIDTSDWETYRNEEYSFEFKYPPEWMVEKQGFGIVNLGPSSTSSVLTIYTQKNSEGENLDQYLKIRDGNMCEGVPCTKVLNKKEIIVAGYPAIQRRESWSDCPCTGQGTYFLRDNLVYVFTEAPISSDSITKKEEILYNQIISTFRFTK